MAVWFDGSNDSLWRDDLNVPANTGQFTMCAWGTKEKTASMYMMSKDSGTRTSNSVFTIGIDSSNRIMGRLMLNGSTIQVRQGSGNTSNNERFHVAMTYDGSTIRVYKNAVLLASSNKTGNVTVNTRDFSIGTAGYSSIRREFRGVIEDCRIYGRGLSQGELEIIINSQGSDYITNGLLNHWPLKEGAAETVPTDNNVFDVVGGLRLQVDSSPLYRNDTIRTSR